MTSILKYYDEKWQMLLDEPDVELHHFDSFQSGQRSFEEMLRKQLYFTDRNKKSKNNWDSIFLRGLLETHQTKALRAHWESKGYL